MNGSAERVTFYCTGFVMKKKKERRKYLFCTPHPRSTEFVYFSVVVDPDHEVPSRKKKIPGTSSSNPARCVSVLPEIHFTGIFGPYTQGPHMVVWYFGNVESESLSIYSSLLRVAPQPANRTHLCRAAIARVPSDGVGDR